VRVKGCYKILSKIRSQKKKALKEFLEVVEYLRKNNKEIKVN